MVGLPATAYYDRRGKLAYLHQGVYPPRPSWPRTSSATLADLLEVRTARTDAELAAALDLRERVFCGEQGVSREADRDGRDGEALHLVAVEEDRVLGTCRLLFRGRIARLGRLAVEPEARGRGIAAAILVEADRRALAAGADRSPSTPRRGRSRSI